MPVEIILTGTQKRIKDSFASSSEVGLALRSNGEEKVSVIDRNGIVYTAGIPAPTTAITLALGGAGDMPDTKWVSYVYVYVSGLFPFVENARAINGSVLPRSNSSPVATLQITGGDQEIDLLVLKTTDETITKIWVFRTDFFDTEIEAATAAAAGTAYFVTELTNDGIAGTVAYTDNNPVLGVDQIEVDNYEAPQFNFCVYADPYWWGFGNLPFIAEAVWNNTHTGSTALITISGDDEWFNGRDGQVITFEGITTGGFDNTGGFRFLRLSATTATVTTDGSTPVALPSTGSGTLTIQGPATTLYRSKPRNPFSWGFTDVIGSVLVPQQFALKVGGGMGTAIAVVPNSALLKLDCEYPSHCLSFNLKAAGTTAFEGTKRTLSNVHSVSAHWSQFPAVTQSGQTVLWGLDFKNFAILQSDGISQQPISNNIPRMLRSLTTDRTKQLLAHGCYDARTELNCIWVTTANAMSLVNYLIYQHAPTGFWGFAQEHDVLCSANIQDSLTGQSKTFVGTQTGFMGQAFCLGTYNNWLPATGSYTGNVLSATATSITVAAPLAFNIIDDGLIGNWVLVTDEDGGTEQLARISAVTGTVLTFDWIRQYEAPFVPAPNTFNPTPLAGYKFFIGLIECRLLKFFNMGQPQTDKQLMELWLTQQGVDAATAGTFIRFYKENQAGYEKIALLQNQYAEQESDAWVCNDTIPSELVKMFGLEFINRGYEQWRFINMALKANLIP